MLGDVTKSKTSSFNENLCLSLVAVNIPWFKLQNPVFRDFLPRDFYLEKKMKFQNATDEVNISIRDFFRCMRSTESKVVHQKRKN